jgi:hypothetical protein
LGRWKKANQSFRLRLHSGLRQSGSAFGAVFVARLKPCPSGQWPARDACRRSVRTCRSWPAGYAFAAIDLGHALFEPLVEGGLADFEPFLLGLEEVECLGDDLGGGGVVAAVELALDALFGCGIEGDRHGGKYTPGGAVDPTHAVRLHEWGTRHPAWMGPWPI